LAQYRELAAFAQFSSDLDPITKAQLDRGARITEILKQGWDEPVPVEEQVITIWAVTNGYLDKTQVEMVKDWQAAYLKFALSKEPELRKIILKEKELSDKTIKILEKVTEKFNTAHPEFIEKEAEL
jgi:F-type H+-transporting ATPase subunit alpha